VYKFRKRAPDNNQRETNGKPMGNQWETNETWFSVGSEKLPGSLPEGCLLNLAHYLVKMTYNSNLKHQSYGTIINQSYCIRIQWKIRKPDRFPQSQRKNHNG
jgi:hypothetical protein